MEFIDTILLLIYFTSIAFIFFKLIGKIKELIEKIVVLSVRVKKLEQENVEINKRLRSNNYYWNGKI